MKKVFIIVGVVIIIACMSFAMVACGMNEFSKIERAFASANETMESMDEVSPEDLSDSNINLSLSQNGTPTFLDADNIVFANSQETPSSGEKVTQILEMRQDIKDSQAGIALQKESLKIERATLKGYIRDFRQQGLELTEDEKTLLASYIDEILGLRDEIKSTIGNVYREMKGLRGKYNLQNVDLVFNTTQSVKEQITIREDAAIRLNEIALELNDYLENRLNPEIEEDNE